MLITDSTCCKRYFGEVLQKQEKLQFLPSNLKFLGRPLDACRAQLKLIGFSMSNLAKLKI